MADWASSAAKVAPGEKVYLFTGAAGNALDWLVRRASTDVTHVVTLRPPLTSDDLGMMLGVGEETQALVVRDIETATDADLTLVLAYLDQPKRRGQSLLLVGTRCDHRDLRAKITRTKGALLVDTTDPTGLAGRKHLIGWVAEEWQTTIAAATLACERASYAIGPLVWATRAFHALTSGHPTEGTRATALVHLAVPLTPSVRAYRLLLERDPAATAAVAALDPSQTLALLRLLEAALTDLMLLHPVLSAGHTAKTAADKTGLHLVRALELAALAPRYPPSVVLRCRQALALGLAHHRQPEAARTVAMLWS